MRFLHIQMIKWANNKRARYFFNSYWHIFNWKRNKIAIAYSKSVCH